MGDPTVNLTLSRTDASRNIAIITILMNYNLHMRLPAHELNKREEFIAYRLPSMLRKKTQKQ